MMTTPFDTCSACGERSLPFHLVYLRGADGSERAIHAACLVAETAAPPDVAGDAA